MDFSVEVSEHLGTLTEPSAPNPAGEAATAEYADIMSNPNNPHHAGYLRRDPSVEKYIDDLFKKAYPQTAPAESSDAGSSERDPAGLSEAEQEAAEDAREMADWQADLANEGVTYEDGLREAHEMAMVIHRADPKLYLEAARRLGDAMGLRLLRLLRQRVNF